MIFRQLFDPVSSTYTYLIGSRRGGEALIIDPVLDRVDRYIQLIRELELELVKAIDTHVHADHISGLGALTGALLSELRDKLADAVIQSERSYRGTLLGARHGVDLVKMIGFAADAAEKLALESFCQSWLQTRSVLVLRAEEAMLWFAQHPEQASRLARPLFRRARRQAYAHAQ